MHEQDDTSESSVHAVVEEEAEDVDTYRRPSYVLGAPVIDVSPLEISNTFSDLFYNKVTSERFVKLSLRNFILERNIKKNIFEEKGVTALLEDRKLLSTVSTASYFVEPIVVEFYANLELSIKSKDSPRYGQVFVCNQILSFTPKVINDFFGTPDVEDVASFDDLNEMAKTLSGGLVTVWPSKKQ